MNKFDKQYSPLRFSSFRRNIQNGSLIEKKFSLPNDVFYSVADKRVFLYRYLRFLHARVEVYLEVYFVALNTFSMQN